jgi:hypothetical protein
MWTLSQVFFVLPTLVLLGTLYFGPGEATRAEATPFARRYLLALSFGPFLVTTLTAAPLGRLPVAMWGYPLWIFAPLGLLALFPPRLGRYQLANFTAGVVAVFLFLPAVYAANELFEPLFTHRVKASRFPGQEMASIMTARWHERTGKPLRYVGGIPSGQGMGEFPANNLATYSPEHPHVIVHGRLELSPWIDPADVDRQGAVFIWEHLTDPPQMPPELKAAFPRVELGPALVLKRQGPFSRDPVIVNYAILPPRP